MWGYSIQNFENKSFSKVKKRFILILLRVQKVFQTKSQCEIVSALLLLNKTLKFRETVCATCVAQDYFQLLLMLCADGAVSCTSCTSCSREQKGQKNMRRKSLRELPSMPLLARIRPRTIILLMKQDGKHISKAPHIQQFPEPMFSAVLPNITHGHTAVAIHVLTSSKHPHRSWVHCLTLYCEAIVLY